MVGPGGDEEHLATCTGIEHLPSGFPHWGETVFEQLNEGESGGLDYVHDGFLARTDAGRYEHGATLCHHQESGSCCFNVSVSHFAGTFHNDLIGAVKQESVTHDRHALVTDFDILLCFEPFGMVAFGPQATRVVLQVTEHGIELAFALQDTVVITLFPKRGQGQFPGYLVAADLKAIDYMPQVARQAVGHVDDAVQMVGYELEGEHSDLGIVLGYFTPTLSDALAQWGGRKPWLGVVAIGALNSTQQWTAPVDNERNHVNAWRLVIVMVVTAFH